MVFIVLRLQVLRFSVFFFKFLGFQRASEHQSVLADAGGFTALFSFIPCFLVLRFQVSRVFRRFVSLRFSGRFCACFFVIVFKVFQGLMFFIVSVKISQPSESRYTSHSSCTSTADVYVRLTARCGNALWRVQSRLVCTSPRLVLL